MLTALSIEPLHSLCLDHWNEVQHDIFGQRCQWCQCQCHMVPMASSMAQLHFLGQDDQTELQHDFLVIWCHWHQHHMLPIALSMAHKTDVCTSTNIPQIPNISQLYQLVHVHIYDNYVSICASYEPNATNRVTRNTNIHFTLLAYTPDQICLPHCTTIVVYM